MTPTGIIIQIISSIVSLLILAGIIFAIYYYIEQLKKENYETLDKSPGHNFIPSSKNFIVPPVSAMPIILANSC